LSNHFTHARVITKLMANLKSMASGSLPTLNSFLRGEMAAVETYRRALTRLGDRGEAGELRACLDSHQRRVEMLRDRVEDLGGVPADEPGPWGAFARLYEGSEPGDEDATIAALEEGEDSGLKLYLDDVCKLDADSRRIVAREILPEQVRTHDYLSDLKLRDAG
jgi:hypothetical protein